MEKLLYDKSSERYIMIKKLFMRFLKKKNMEHNHKLKIFIRFLKKNKIYHKFLTNSFSSNGFKTRSEYYEYSTPSLIDFISNQLKR
jgi:hypothetical protein